MSRADIYEKVTASIVAQLETVSGAWRMPWHCKGGQSVQRPVNVVSKKAYRGLNVLLLWERADARAFETGVWGTYRQWESLGGQVRKGEKGTEIVFWKVIDAKDADDSDDEGESSDGKQRKRFFARGYHVFNVAQVDGYKAPALPAPPQNPAARNQAAERFAHACGIETLHGGDRAYYSPALDHVRMPTFDQFRDAEGYYATLLHEYTHATGHEKRLARDFSGRFGNAAYAFEELIAELGAAFLCADLGIANEPRTDHAQYLASWLRVLKDDKRAIFTAASRAQSAADWLHAQQSAEMKRAA